MEHWEARELGVSMETTGPAPYFTGGNTRPWLGVAQQLDLRCQVAWTP